VRRRRDGDGASAQKGDGVGVAERRRGQADGVRVFRQGGGPCIGPGEGAGAVKAGNDRRQCLGLKAPVTGVFKSGGASFNGGMKEEAMWRLFLFSGGGRGGAKPAAGDGWRALVWCGRRKKKADRFRGRRLH
jgi:hypothetical protein